MACAGADRLLFERGERMTLQKNILLILVSLLLTTLLVIAGVGYFTTRDSVRDLRARIMSTKRNQVAGELKHYFGQTEPAIEFMRNAVFSDADAAMEDWRGSARVRAD